VSGRKRIQAVAFFYSFNDKRRKMAFGAYPNTIYENAKPSVKLKKLESKMDIAL